MKCSVSGCQKESQYKKRGICQMHYFRHMRTGSYDLQERTLKKEHITPNGYSKIRRVGHPLAIDGYVYKHRFIAYLKYGGVISSCAMCGADIGWDSCHIDHIDCNRLNNSPENLRPLCNSCNTRRGRKPEHEYDHCMGLEFNGEIKSASEWEKDHRVKVSASCIRQRKRRGMSDVDALFSEKKTHKSKNT